MQMGFKLVLLSAIFTVTVIAVNAQSCPGSYLTYLVRDAKGKIMPSPNSGDLTYSGGTPDGSQKWRFGIKGEFVNHGVKLPDAIAAIAENVTGMTISRFCNFTDPVALKLTMENKTMELIFVFPNLGEQESSDFVVDSLAFKPGKYKMTLTRSANVRGAYYAPNGWKPVK